MPKRSTDRLIEENMSYVRAVAARVLRLLPPGTVALEELVACGNQGLVEAAARFDPARGTSFITFAHYRIRGAIFDGLREQQVLERSAGASFEEIADAYISQRFGGATFPGDPAQDIYDVLQDLGRLFLSCQEHAHAWGVDSFGLLHAKEVREALDGAVEVLPPRERLLIRMYYEDGLTLKEAGERLGVSLSWCSRLHARALGRLRRELMRRRRAPAPALQASSTAQHKCSP
jgi:RNA polymerase sigma factor for flagellar operon FliA